jgi:hypothetical protein
MDVKKKKSKQNKVLKKLNEKMKKKRLSNIYFTHSRNFPVLQLIKKLTKVEVVLCYLYD